MIDRRTLFGAAAAVTTAVGSAFSGRKTRAAHTNVNLTPEGDVEPRGPKGRLERLPALDLESKHDFVTGFRQFHGQFNRIANNRIEKILKDNRLDPKGRYTMEKVLAGC